MTSTRIANGVTLILLLVAGSVVLAHYRSHTISTGRLANSSLRDALPIEFSTSPRTLVIVVRQGCEYCTANMQFYRQLIEVRNRRSANLRITAAAPATDMDAQSYLESNGVLPDTFVHFRAGHIPLQIAPTLLVMDRDGSVMSMWEGFVSERQQQAILKALFTD